MLEQSAEKAKVFSIVGVCRSVGAGFCVDKKSGKIGGKATCTHCLIFNHRVATRMEYDNEYLLQRRSTQLSTKNVDPLIGSPF
jgi:hypothetical protein